MRRQIYRLAIPNIISNITIPFVGLVDVALMGRFDSPAYLGAIALGSMLFTVVYSGMSFLRMGTTGITAQNYGASNFRGSAYTLFRALIIAVGFGIIFLALQKPISILFFGLLNAGDDVVFLATEYFNYRIWASPAALSIFAFSGWFLGNQNAKIPMIVAIIINITNIVLSAYFVLILGMDVDGAALGTVIAQYTGLLACIYFYFKKFSRYNLFYDIKKIIDRYALKDFFEINSNILIRSLLVTGSFYYFNAVSAGLGDDILAVNSLLLQFLWIFSYFIDGFAYAAEALVGKFFGAGDKGGLKLVIKKLMSIGLVISIAISVIYFFADSMFLRLLSSNTELIELSREYSFWIWFIPVISFSAFIMDGIFIGATKTKTMRNVMIFSVIIVFVPVLHLLKHYFDNHGMWLALSIMLLFRGVGLIFKQKVLFEGLNVAKN